MRRSIAVIALLCAILVPLFAADTTLIASGSVWKFLDNGTDQGATWKTLSFNDSAWNSGPAQLGYGDGDEATVVGYGPSSSNKYITTYFRRVFNVSSPLAFTKVTLRVLRDDGAVVYLNGTEVFRTNMPSVTIGYQTLAFIAPDAEETTFQSTTIDPALLLPGANVIAVEVHQASAASSDITFDLDLAGGNSGAAVTRAPYLQRGTESGIIVRWRTDLPTDSRVLFGANRDALNLFTNNTAITTEHTVALTGLLPDTRYYYSVGTSTETLAGGDGNHYFYTQPPAGTVRPIRIWAIGDPQFGGATAQAVRDSYLSYTGTTRTDVWLTLGDHADPYGTESEFQTEFFNIFEPMLRNTVLWPTIGNHDMGETPDFPPPTLPYFSIFNPPAAGEAGGMASGTIRYYSFTYGNIHFISLDAMSNNLDANSPMLNWLKQDLAATHDKWTIAYWHHPPYSKGPHDSDTTYEEIQLRESALPILEAANVDLVLCGHSHVYERSFLLDGHYGMSNTFTNAYKINGGDGRIGGNGAYTKAGVSPHEGTVYIVAGTASFPLDLIGIHPAMFTSMDRQAGSLVLDVNGDQLDVKFLRETGAIADFFTIRKGSAPPTVPTAPRSLTAIAGLGIATLIWTDDSSNETGFQIEQGTDGISFPVVKTVAAGITSYTVAGLSAGTKYYFRVRAYNAAGSSAYSPTASATPTGAPSTVTPIAANSVWKYLDNGSNAGTAWRAAAFNDAAWKTGAAQLGYGDGDEATVVGYGPSASNKYVTTYFRQGFTVQDRTKITKLMLGLIRDDGAVVYLNGVEVFRSNMPSGTIGYQTLAYMTPDDQENVFQTATADPTLLVNGTNVIAVEVHQAGVTSSDISFALELKAEKQP
jgi:hypothetical protein